MSTRLSNGFPGIICQTCKGTGQERYQTTTLPAEFNACNGRYEGDLFIRKCIKCDGLGALADLTGMQAVPHKVELKGATPYQGVAGGVMSFLGF